MEGSERTPRGHRQHRPLEMFGQRQNGRRAGEEVWAPMMVPRHFRLVQDSAPLLDRRGGERHVRRLVNGRGACDEGDAIKKWFTEHAVEVDPALQAARPADTA